MEHAQREVSSKVITAKLEVLILILMEHAQRVKTLFYLRVSTWCLNPYFNGTCSKRSWCAKHTSNALCLNPYFNGTCSKRTV